MKRWQKVALVATAGVVALGGAGGASWPAGSAHGELEAAG
ncbi:MAG: hypothetical protein RLZZ561_234 [Pseudomonadota bacterium]|jgi:hypothetical protein